MKARCKFNVQTVTLHPGYGGVPGDETIRLSTMYDENDPEDTKFSTATPSGHMEFRLSNPALLGKFKPGTDFYVTLEPVEESD